MRMWAIGAAGATLLTASFVALGAGPALADGTNGNGSILGGNQVNAPISIPINACGNSVAVIGGALSGCEGGSKVRGGGYADGGHHTSGAHSILGGNQVNAPIAAPINACGNSVAVIGGALSGCEGGSKVRGGGYPGGGHHTSGAHSIGGGNQVHAPISAPINVCGNAAAVLGDALAGCKGGASVRNGGGSGFHGRTSGRHSILGGNQVQAPVNAPINVCGNAVGNALAGCQGGAKVRGTGYAAGGGHTNGTHSILGGNQVHAPVTAPVNVCGNAVAVVGHALAACRGSAVGAPGGYYGGGHGRTSGRGSVGGGNQVHAPVTAPVDVCGNAAAVIGGALGSCGGQSGYTGGGYTGGGDDCVTPSSYRMSGANGINGDNGGLPRLPVDPGSLRTGALPVAMGATPALPKLAGHAITPQSARNGDPLGGVLRVPPVGGPPKQLPPVHLAAAGATSGSQSGAQSGALLALALGGMFAASAGSMSVVRRLSRRSSR